MVEEGDGRADEKEGEGGVLPPVTGWLPDVGDAVTDRPPLLRRTLWGGEPTGEEVREVARDIAGVSIFKSDSALANAEGVEGDIVVELVCELADGGEAEGVEATENG